MITPEEIKAQISMLEVAKARDLLEQKKLKRQQELNAMCWIDRLQQEEYKEKLERLERNQRYVFEWCIKEKYRVKGLDIDEEFAHFFLALLKKEVKSINDYIKNKTNWLNGIQE